MNRNLSLRTRFCLLHQNNAKGSHHDQDIRNFYGANRDIVYGISVSVTFRAGQTARLDARFYEPVCYLGKDFNVSQRQLHQMLHGKQMCNLPGQHERLQGLGEFPLFPTEANARNPAKAIAQVIG